MSKRGRKSKAGTLDFWNSKEGKRQIARQLKAEDVSATVQRKAADARLLEDGWVRSPPLSGQYVQKSDVATAAYNSLSAEAQSAIQDAGKHGKNYGVKGKESGVFGKQYGILGKQRGVEGKDWWLNASKQELDSVISQGQEWHKYADIEETEAQKLAGRNWQFNAHPDDLAAVKQCGKEAFNTLSFAQRETILSGTAGKWAATREEQRIGGVRGLSVQIERAEAIANTAGPPVLPAGHDGWLCPGGCDFACVSEVNIANFIGTSDIEILKWVYCHGLVDRTCKACGHEMHPIARGIYTSAACDHCHVRTKGGLNGFWSKGKLGILK